MPDGLKPWNLAAKKTIMLTSDPSHASKSQIISGFVLSIIIAIIMVWIELAPHAPNLPVNDQWEFLAPVIYKKSFWEQFNQQILMPRQGLGNLIYSIPEITGGWSGKGQMATMLSFLALASCLALGLKSRLQGLQMRDMLLPFIFIKPVMQDTLVYTPNPSYSSLPVMLLFAVLLVADHLARRSRESGFLTSALGYLILIVLLWLGTWTGFGFFIPIGVIAWTFFEKIRPDADQKLDPFGGLWFFIISLLPLVFFFIAPGNFESDAQCLDVSKFSLPRWLEFSGRMMLRGIGLRLPSQLQQVAMLALPLIIAGCVAALIQSGKRRRWTPIFFACLIFSATFAASASAGRWCLGPEGALASRYTGIMIPVCFCIWLIIDSRKWLGWLAIFFLVVGGYRQLPIDGRLMQFVTPIRQTIETCLMQTADMQKCLSLIPSKSEVPAIWFDMHESDVLDKLYILRQRNLGPWRKATTVNDGTEEN